jgi:hypothetical protein
MVNSGMGWGEGQVSQVGGMDENGGEEMRGSGEGERVRLQRTKMDVG